MLHSHSNSNENPNFADQQQTTNPRTGRTERVFANLQAVYGNGGRDEMSFEELRARSRGWLNRGWMNKTKQNQAMAGGKTAKKTVDQSTKADTAESTQIHAQTHDSESTETSPSQSGNTTALDLGHTVALDFGRGPKEGQGKKKKVKEIRGETQTSRRFQPVQLSG